MEGIARVFFILTVFLGTLTVNVTEARMMKSNEEVDQPQTFGLGTPGFPQILPSPFPPVFPGFPFTIPSPGIGGSFPSPGFGSGSGSWCSLPGIICPPVQPTATGPTGSVEGGAGVSGSP